MVEVTDKGYMEVGSIPVVVFKERVFIQQLLCGVFMLSVSCVYKDRFEAEIVSLCILGTGFIQVSCNPFDLTSDDEYSVVVSTEGVEGVAITLSLVEGGVVCTHFSELHMMELRSVTKTLLGPCAVFKKDLIYTEIRIVDSETISFCCVSICYGLLQLSYIFKKIESLFLREIIDYT